MLMLIQYNVTINRVFRPKVAGPHQRHWSCMEDLWKSEGALTIVLITICITFKATVRRRGEVGVYKSRRVCLKSTDKRQLFLGRLVLISNTFKLYNASQMLTFSFKTNSPTFINVNITSTEVLTSYINVVKFILGIFYQYRHRTHFMLCLAVIMWWNVALWL